MMDERTTDETPGAATLERRRAPRISPARRLTVSCVEGVMSPFGWGESHELPTVLDLSSGGLRLQTQRRLETGSVLCIEIEADGTDPVEALGEVRWSREGADGCQAGVQFFGLRPTQIDVMRAFLEKQAAGSK